MGKSALFNRLVGRRAALVQNTPAGHVTRDWKEGSARLGDLDFTVVDTSGLEPELGTRNPGSIQGRAAVLTASVLARADVTLFLMDGRTGILPGDLELARWLRRLPPPHRVLLVANKCERPEAVAAGLAEAPRLGFGAAVAIAAESGEGMAELYGGLQPFIDEARERGATISEADGDKGYEDQAPAPRSIFDEDDAEDSAEDSDSDSDSYSDSGAQGDPYLRLAIVGVPNVGKSTLCNALLRSERCLTGPEPGLTRDAVRARFRYAGKTLELVDTAGWVRRARLAAHDPDAGGVLTQRSLAEGAAAMHSAQVVVLVLDATRCGTPSPRLLSLLWRR